MSFHFVGAAPPSKSLLNRLHIIKSFFSNLEIVQQTQAKDIVHMKRALEQFADGETQFHCGLSGTAFRFLALRVSRKPGKWRLTAEPGLINRPHQGLLKVLRQLSCAVELDQQGLTIESQGWRLQGDGLQVPMGETSQIASAVALSSWDLPNPLFISLQDRGISDTYFLMTLRLLQRCGMEWKLNGSEFVIAPSSELLQSKFSVEPDFSSAFSLAALAAVDGDIQIQGDFEESLQPDAVFPEVLAKLGVDVETHSKGVRIKSSGRLIGGKFNLKTCPDLFPSLAVLCALAKGESEILGAPHLKYKESNRIAKIAELLKPLGRTLEILDDGIKISGQIQVIDESWQFDPENDHRMAMAAALLIKSGYKVSLSNPKVVDKSFPEFWDIIGVDP